MDTLSLNYKTLFQVNAGLSDSALQTFNIQGLVETMKHSSAWLKGELNSMILMRSPAKQMVLSTLHAGTTVSSFQSCKSITFQVIEGKLKFHSHRRKVVLNIGQCLTLHQNIKYKLTTRETSVLLLIIEKETVEPLVNLLSYAQ